MWRQYKCEDKNNFVHRNDEMKVTPCSSSLKVIKSIICIWYGAHSHLLLCPTKYIYHPRPTGWPGALRTLSTTGSVNAAAHPLTTDALSRVCFPILLKGETDTGFPSHTAQLTVTLFMWFSCSGLWRMPTFVHWQSDSTWQCLIVKQLQFNK